MSDMPCFLDVFLWCKYNIFMFCNRDFAGYSYFLILLWMLFHHYFVHVGILIFLTWLHISQFPNISFLFCLSLPWEKKKKQVKFGLLFSSLQSICASHKKTMLPDLHAHLPTFAWIYFWFRWFSNLSHILCGPPYLRGIRHNSVQDLFWIYLLGKHVRHVNDTWDWHATHGPY